MKFFDILVSILGISLLAFLTRDLLPDDFNVMPRYQYEFTDRNGDPENGMWTLTIENITVSPDQVKLVWISKFFKKNKLTYQRPEVRKFEECKVIDQDNWTCELFLRRVIQMVNGSLETDYYNSRFQPASKKLKVLGVVIPL